MHLPARPDEVHTVVVADASTIGEHQLGARLHRYLVIDPYPAEHALETRGRSAAWSFLGYSCGSVESIAVQSFAAVAHVVHHDCRLCGKGQPFEDNLEQTSLATNSRSATEPVLESRGVLLGSPRYILFQRGCKWDSEAWCNMHQRSVSGILSPHLRGLEITGLEGEPWARRGPPSVFREE